MTTIEKAIQTYGKDAQLTVAIEELSELIKEICKSKRGADNRTQIVEELADCHIMLDQIALIFDIGMDEIGEMMIDKIIRLEKILKEKEENDLARKLASIGETLIDNFSEDVEDE